MSDFHKKKAEKKKSCKLIFNQDSLEQWKKSEYIRIRDAVNKEMEERYQEREARLRASLKEQSDDIAKDSVDKAFVIMIGIATRVLKEQYGFGTKKRLPEFAEHVVDYYSDFQEGKDTVEEYLDQVEKECGLRFTATPVGDN